MRPTTSIHAAHKTSKDAGLSAANELHSKRNESQNALLIAICAVFHFYTISPPVRCLDAKTEDSLLAICLSARTLQLHLSTRNIAIPRLASCKQVFFGSSAVLVQRWISYSQLEFSLLSQLGRYQEQRHVDCTYVSIDNINSRLTAEVEQLT